MIRTTTLRDQTRGLFAGEVGAPRLLKRFERYNLTTTWFIPGHSIETFPEQMKAVVEAGHEVGVHGYSHENPIAMTREQERDVLDYNIELVTQLFGKRPTGYVAPWSVSWHGSIGLRLLPCLAYFLFF